MLSHSCGVLFGDGCAHTASHKFPAILLRLEDTGYALVLVLIDEGLGRLAHFTNTNRHGIVRDSKVILHAGVPVPGGQLNK